MMTFTSRCIVFVCFCQIVYGFERDKVYQVTFEEPVDDVSTGNTGNAPASTFNQPAGKSQSTVFADRVKSTDSASFGNKDISRSQDQDAANVELNRAYYRSQCKNICFPNVCLNASCPIYPEATCISDPCGCKFRFMKSRIAPVDVTDVCNKRGNDEDLEDTDMAADEDATISQNDLVTTSQCPKVCSPTACADAICNKQKNATCLTDICGCSTRFLTLSPDRSTLVDITEFCENAPPTTTAGTAPEIPVIPDGNTNKMGSNSSFSNLPTMPVAPSNGTRPNQAGSWKPITPAVGPSSTGNNQGKTQLPVSAQSGWGSQAAVTPVVSAPVPTAQSWGQQAPTGLTSQFRYGYPTNVFGGGLLSPLAFGQNGLFNTGSNIASQLPFASLMLPGYSDSPSADKKSEGHDEDQDESSTADDEDTKAVVAEDSDEDQDSDEKVQLRVRRDSEDEEGDAADSAENVELHDGDQEADSDAVSDGDSVSSDTDEDGNMDATVDDNPSAVRVRRQSEGEEPAAGEKAEAGGAEAGVAPDAGGAPEEGGAAEAGGGKGKKKGGKGGKGKGKGKKGKKSAAPEGGEESSPAAGAQPENAGAPEPGAAPAAPGEVAPEPAVKRVGGCRRKCSRKRRFCSRNRHGRRVCHRRRVCKKICN